MAGPALSQNNIKAFSKPLELGNDGVVHDGRWWHEKGDWRYFARTQCQPYTKYIRSKQDWERYDGRDVTCLACIAETLGFE